MKYIIILFIVNISVASFAQKKVPPTEIYMRNNLAYFIGEDQPFTGIVESSKSKFRETFIDGYKSKYIRYKDSEKNIIAYETFFRENSFVREKQFDYSKKNKIRKRYFDENGNLNLMEIFEKGTLTYSCEYLNGKKNGKEFCVTKKCEKKTDLYINGKKAK